MNAVANVLLVPALIVTVLAFGAVIRRLLGVRVGMVRTGLAALLACGTPRPARRRWPRSPP